MSKDLPGTVSKVSTWGGCDVTEVTIRLDLDAYKDFQVGDDVTVNVKEAP